jgi:uncharacterized protein (TIGR00303 family)
MAGEDEYLVVGESVPGGTTTALSLLLALGVAADGRVSSSLAGNAHPLKSRLAHQALACLPPGTAEKDPLGAVAVLGDPMQAAAAGLAAGAMASGTPVLLAGGTQMVAVAALLQRLGHATHARPGADTLGVATTRWVVEDATADAAGLMRDAVPDVPLLATELCFADPRHPLLREYERGLVKEGVGAGGAAVAATWSAGVSCRQIEERVDELYDELPTNEAVVRG